MINVFHTEPSKLASSIKVKTNLSISFQLLAAIDIVSTFRHFGAFEATHVKYEFLSYYSESVLERTLRCLVGAGFLVHNERSYKVVEYVY